MIIILQILNIYIYTIYIHIIYGIYSRYKACFWSESNEPSLFPRMRSELEQLPGTEPGVGQPRVEV